MFTAMFLLMVSQVPPDQVKVDPKPRVEVGVPSEDTLAEAKELADREEWEDAAAQYRDFFETHPNHLRASEARFWAGYCLIKLGENEAAEDVLAPFAEKLARDRWADDALLQLGQAWIGLGKPDQALVVWQSHLANFPDSQWRLEVALGVVDLLLHHIQDYQACFEHCERMVQEVEDRGSIAEARYAGAYCLNALERFEDSEAWVDRLFDPQSSLEEGWRRLLNAHRDLIRGKLVAASAAVESLTTDFAELDQGERKDLILRTSLVLRSNASGDRARELILEELRRPSGRSEGEIEEFLSELSEAIGQDRRSDFLSTLAKLSVEPGTPVVVRVTSRSRLVQAFIEADKVEEAEDLLTRAIADETTDFARFRAAMQLAEVLTEHKDDDDGALKVLEAILPRLSRRDLIRQVDDKIAEYKPEVQAI